MEFQVPCDCGEHFSVTEGSAGASLLCRCGRKITVPALAELRMAAGLPPIKPNPALIIAEMNAAGELPLGETCINCGMATEEMIEVVAELERSWTTRKKVAGSTVVLPTPVGILHTWEEEITVHGKDLMVPVPMMVCRSCQRGLVRNVFIPVLYVLKYALAAIGIVMLILWSGWWASLIGASVLTWWIEKHARTQQLAAIQRLLRQEPIYTQLLDDYPGADLVLKRSVSPKRARNAL